MKGVIEVNRCNLCGIVINNKEEMQSQDRRMGYSIPVKYEKSDSRFRIDNPDIASPGPDIIDNIHICEKCIAGIIYLGTQITREQRLEIIGLGDKD